MGDLGDIQLGAVSVTAELERIGWHYEPAGPDELKVRCPAHPDASPSCSLNVQKRVFNCKSADCAASGDFITFLSLALKTTRGVIVADLANRYALRPDKLIDSETIERYHQAIWASGPLLQALRDRGLTDEMIRLHRLGYDRGRITIPVYSEAGLCVNVRKYLPGAPGHLKMKNARGHGEARLYPIDQLRFDTVILAGGECKAIVAAHHMNVHGIGSLCVAAGEGAWLPEFGRKLRGKRVFVCQDVDDAGRAAAQKYCAHLSAEARFVGDLVLPLNRDRYPKGDLNDYFGQEGATGLDLLRLIESTERWKPPEAELSEADEPATEVDLVSLAESTLASTAGRRIRVRALVAALDTTPYLVPKLVRCSCDRSQKNCAVCPVYARTPGDDGTTELTVSPESPAILSMVETSTVNQREAIRRALRIPKCKVVEFRVAEQYNVEDVRLAPQITMSSSASERTSQPALVVGHGLEANLTYEIEGRCWPDPRTQHAVILASKIRPAEDDLGSFSPSETEMAELSVFQPAAWTTEGIGEKLADLYADLETNVTKIYHRRDVHLVMDLVWHSTLLFRADGRDVKGWSECLVIGDSSQGKSEVALRLREHYGLGGHMVCKAGISRSGIIGGLAPMGNRFFVSWGKVPMYDRQALVMDEVKGMPSALIGDMTDMRSSGIAEVTMIEKRRTHARTRLIWVTNAPDDRAMKLHNFGVDAITRLIRGPEDIRRFDIAIVVAADDVDAARLNALAADPPRVVARHTAPLCRRLVLWAWTRTSAQVEITDEAAQGIFAGSVLLCSEFTETIPLVDRGSIRHKIARLAIGLACRTYSCARHDPSIVVVRGCHVEYVVSLLRRLYSAPSFGYADFSAAARTADELKDVPEIRRKIRQLPYPVDFVDQMLHTNEIELRDICDWCGWEKREGIELLSFLVRKHALVREDRHYRKTGAFIEVLKGLKTDTRDRPAYVKDGKF